jgi:hypothetical protein
MHNLDKLTHIRRHTEVSHGQRHELYAVPGAGGRLVVKMQLGLFSFTQEGYQHRDTLFRQRSNIVLQPVVASRPRRDGEGARTFQWNSKNTHPYSTIVLSGSAAVNSSSRPAHEMPLKHDSEIGLGEKRTKCSPPMGSDQSPIVAELLASTLGRRSAVQRGDVGGDLGIRSTAAPHFY